MPAMSPTLRTAIAAIGVLAAATAAAAALPTAPAQASAWTAGPLAVTKDLRGGGIGGLEPALALKLSALMGAPYVFTNNFTTRKAIEDWFGPPVSQREITLTKYFGVALAGSMALALLLATKAGR